MKLPVKLLIAFFTLLPIAYMVYFFISFFNFTNDLGNFELLMILHVSVMLLTLGLLTFYIINAYRTTKIPADKKSLWIIILFFGSFIAMAIYWYLYIWRSVPDQEAENKDIL